MKKKVKLSIEELNEISIALNDSVHDCRRFRKFIREDRTISELQRRRNLRKSIGKENRLRDLRNKINREIERRLDK